MFWIIMGSVLAGTVGVIFFFYYLKKGHFEDLEEVKYQMFHEDDDAEI